LSQSRVDADMGYWYVAQNDAILDILDKYIGEGIIEDGIQTRIIDSCAGGVE
jgi:hypothetical protein